METGHQKVPREFWENCDTVLGAGQTFATRYAEIHEAASRDREPVARRRRMAAVPAVGSAAPRLTTGEDPDQEPIVVTLAAEALDLATWAEQTNVGDMTIDALADGASRLARDYLQKPPLPVLREAASAYRRVSGLLIGGHQSLRQTRDLYVIAGRLLAFLSWAPPTASRNPCHDHGTAGPPSPSSPGRTWLAS